MMGDVIHKLRILRELIRGTVEQWTQDVWRRDLDAPYCCDGRECGCGAATVRDIYPSSKETPDAQ